MRLEGNGAMEKKGVDKDNRMCSMRREWEASQEGNHRELRKEITRYRLVSQT